MDGTLPPPATTREALLDLAATLGKVLANIAQLQLALAETHVALWAGLDEAKSQEAAASATAKLTQARLIGMEAYDELIVLMKGLAGDG